MRVFMNNCTKNSSIQFFKHQYPISVRSISRYQRLRMPKEKVKSLGSSTVHWCGYADNQVLFMLDINSLERATTIFDEVFTNCGLCLNIP